MEILIVCLIAWGVVTLVGHGTWVLMRLIFASSPSKPAIQQTAPTKPPEAHRDLVAFTRMVDALVSTGQLSGDAASDLKRNAGKFVDTLGDPAAPPAVKNPTAARPGVAVPDFASNPLIRPVVSTLEVPTADSIAPAETVVPPSTIILNAPRRAFADMVASFLAQHNIRWGELIAGMMIVVCSIGLVLSLWNTLTAAHRVVPAVVFMSADAAIFAAGLYTMRRWKLRHTSRAVLIVATLLVPLCVLAGLAAAGASSQSVSLGDPVTLGVIVVATTGCGWLLWQASMALVGRGAAGPLMASVVASSLTLPLLPTAARLLGAGAGWVVIVPALAAAVSLMFRRPMRVVTGRRVWKNQCLHLGIVIAALVSVIAYAAYLFRDDGRAVWIQIAIATVPVWVSIAGVFGNRAIAMGKFLGINSNVDRAKDIATRRFVGTVVAAIAVGLIIAIVPASIQQVSWLWSHAIVASVSVLVMTGWLRRSTPTADGILPIGIAVMMTSPVWLAGQSWSSVAVYRTVLGGEPMMTAIGCLAIGVFAFAVTQRRVAAVNASCVRWTGIWALLVAVQAIVLSFSPAEWRGRMPLAGIALSLVAIVIASVVASLVHPKLAKPKAGFFVSLVAGFSLATLIGGRGLWGWESLSNAHSLWSLGGVVLGVGVVWILVRFALTQRKIIEFDASSQAMIVDSLRAAVLLFGLAILWQYGSVVVGPLIGNSVGRMSFLSLPEASVLMMIFRGCGLVTLAAACYFGIQASSSELRKQLMSKVGWIGALFVAATVSLACTDVTSWQVVIMTTIASGCLVAVGGYYPSHSTTTVLALVVAIGSAILLIHSWLWPIMAGVSPDRWVTFSVSAWWLVASIVLACSQWSSKRIASAVLVPLSFGLVASISGNTSHVVWFQATAFGSLAWIGIQRLFRLVGTMGDGIVARSLRDRASGNESLSDSATAVLPAVRSGPWVQIAERFGDYRFDDHHSGDEASAMSIAWVRIVGGTSAALVVLGIVLGVSWATAWSLPVGWLTTVLGLGTFLKLTSSRSTWASRLPLAVPIMSGHVACLAVPLGWIHSSEMWMVVSACGLVGSIGSSIVLWRGYSTVHAWHVCMQTLVLFASAIAFSDHFFGAIAIAGLVVAAVALMRMDSPLMTRILGWLVVLGGNYLVVTLLNAYSVDRAWLTGLMAWTGVCVILWRCDRPFDSKPLSISRADVEASALLLPMLGSGLLLVLNAGSWQSAVKLETTITHAVLQCGIGIAVGASAWLRSCNEDVDPLCRTARTLWFCSLGLLIGSVAFASAIIATIAGAEVELRWLTVSLSASFAVAVAGWLLYRHAHTAVGLALERVIMSLAVFSTLIAIGISNQDVFSGSATETMAAWTRMSVLSIGVLAWAMFGLAEQTATSALAASTDSTVSTDWTGTVRRRHRCVALGLWMVALIAVLGSSASLIQDGGPSGISILIATMRLLIASTLAIAMLTLVIPQLLSGQFVDRWQAALRRGGLISGVTAACSLLLMLGLEAVLRQRGFGVNGLAMPIVIVVGVMLGGLALMAGLIAVWSGPGFESTSKTSWLQLEDGKRKRLLYAAQGIAAVTWLHLFLCRSGIAYLGLRQVWPYVVMVIAFASVGLTQWAVRRRDTVLAETMRRTAMFLPMIPVIGFWLSGSFATFWHDQEWSWIFYRGTTSYQGLLVVGAIYYGVVSLIWKNAFPRVATVVLANAGLWVMLTQSSGWGFLAHPQAWLIPPAACVLAVAHWQRDALDAKIGSAIRYAASLVIYLTSTADMLMSEIGTSLWGPVILIGLSLIGMLAGVALRVKPFLYLGTIFTFLGVMSMVWHAGQAIDAVWPWWVFGISTGLVLLSILAGIEKHRDQLQRWSDRLATWD